jgi:putative transposase
MADSYDKLAVALKKQLPRAFLEALGRSTGFIQRLRTVSAPDFVWAVVLSRFSAGAPGFDQARHLFRQMTATDIWPRPFQMRFKSKKVVTLFEEVFEASVARWRERRRIAHPLAKHFTDIVAVDSTVVQLNDRLRPHFKGQRWAKSQMKIGLAVSVFGLVPLLARLVCRCVHDSKLFFDLTAFRPRTLLLVDNAFVSYENLGKTASNGLLFVCPMRCNANAQIVGVHAAPKRVREALLRHPGGVSLRTLLDKDGYIGCNWDLKVTVRPTVGEDRRDVSLRLVIVPHKRRPRYYLTNLDPKWSPAAVAELYRLRWQIELVFKELKQHLALESVPTKDPNAAQALVWASLIALTVSRVASSCLTPLERLNGLAARHCVAVVSRALSVFSGLLALIAAGVRSSPLARALAANLDYWSTRRTAHRPDTFRRLIALLPAAA